MTLLPLKAAAALAVAMFALVASPIVAAEEKAKLASPKSSISEKRLIDFVAAAKDVFAIRQKYAPQFEAATTNEDKEKVVRSAQGEMKKAILNRGLTIEQYNDVLVAAKDDQALADRIGKMMDDGKPGKGG